MREHSLQFIEPLNLSNLITRIIARGGSKLRENFRDVHRHRFARAPHRVLLNHMAGNRKKISLGTANDLVCRLLLEKKKYDRKKSLNIPPACIEIYPRAARARCIS